jgi:hypothetical protein
MNLVSGSLEAPRREGRLAAWRGLRGFSRYFIGGTHMIVHPPHTVRNGARDEFTAVVAS